MIPARFLKVIACEIALREICHVAAQSPSLVDFEFLTQGLHDDPRAGVHAIQARIDAVPAGRYDAILVGYGLCGNIVGGLQARHTPLVLPRAHDCITLFLGSKERYARCSTEQTGTYYYTSGWLECLRRRGGEASMGDAAFLPSRAGLPGSRPPAYDRWVEKFGEENARFLLETMDDWTRHYTHGTLIDFEFTRPLQLDRPVRAICHQRGWTFQSVPGDLGLLQRWVDGDWSPADFLVVPPGACVAPSHQDSIVQLAPHPAAGPHGPAAPDPTLSPPDAAASGVQFPAPPR